jgi:tetratricopeptide (TPR) repeat protein
MGCHVKKTEESVSKEPLAAEDVKVITLTPQALKSKEDFKNFLESINTTDMPPQQLVKQSKDLVSDLTLLDISDTNKKELNEILKYLDNIKSPSDYFNDVDNIIDFMQTVARSNIILAEIEPDDFHVNYKAAQQYTNLGYMIESLSQSEKHNLLSDDYKKKGVQASKDLVERFPDEAEGYAQFAFSVIVAEGDRQKALELFKRCLELDPKSEYCRNNYDDLSEEYSREK